MSMQAWDVPNPNDNSNGFPNTIDPSMAFAGGTPTSSNFDFASMQNPQMRAMQNGQMRNGSPAGFNPSMYQSTPVVPAKRQHDFGGGSPRQASRSQTPQQGPYPGYNGANGQTPNPYQHLQNSSNASPSPIMQNQAYNPSAIPGRLSTASPSPYSPAGQNFGAQASPVQSDYGHRVDTPTGPGFMPGQMANGMTPNSQFSPQASNMMPGYAGANGMPGYQAGMVDPQRARQAQMMRQVQAQTMAAQQRAQAQMQAQAQAQSQPGGMANSQMAGMQQRALREQIMRFQASRLEAVTKQPEAFATTVATFNAERGQPFQKHCVVNQRPLHCALIFNFVIKAGGSRRLTMTNGWQQIAQALQIGPQFVGEIQNYYQQNLASYEPVWQQAMQHQGQKLAMQQQAAMTGQQQQQQDSSTLQAQMSANRAMQYSQEQMAAMQARKQQTAPDTQTPMKPPQQTQQANGMSPPGQNSAGPPQPQSTPIKSASVDPKAEPDVEIGGETDHWTKALKDQIGETFEPLSRKVPQLSTDPSFQHEESQEHHGGFMLGSSTMNMTVANATRVRPDNPRISDLGTIELQAVLMSLKSGIPGEVRLALDTISAMIWEPTALLGPLGPKSEQMPGPGQILPGQVHRIDLDFKSAGDLVESLADCAEAQLDFLADNTELDEFSDIVSFRPVEEVARECMTEMNSLQDIPEHGSFDYELEQAAEKLLCITTILRNVTEHPSPVNRHAISDSSVVKVMANVIRHLGTRHMLLRTWRNTFDFLKDAVIYFSAVASEVKLSSKDEASWILQFLLSFAPPIQQVTSEDAELYFPAYVRGSHKYLPFAIQTLAKILASGDPNRAYLKSVFAADIAVGSAPDLLTRAFGMCISPLPSMADDIYPKLRTRATFLTQGLLAADSLVTMIPPSEHGLARAWLSSEDAFAERLLRIIAKISINFQAPVIRTPHGALDDGLDMVQEYGISILRKLGETAKDAEVAVGQPSASVILKRAVLAASMSAVTLQQQHPERTMQREKTLHNLVGYLSLDI